MVEQHDMGMHDHHRRNSDGYDDHNHDDFRRSDSYDFRDTSLMDRENQNNRVEFARTKVHH